ncbi:hypothetical protein XENOCAPTIV_003126, partial [Xenoophorus captivus]
MALKKYSTTSSECLHLPETKFLSKLRNIFQQHLTFYDFVAVETFTDRKQTGNRQRQKEEDMQQRSQEIDPQTPAAWAPALPLHRIHVLTFKYLPAISTNCTHF